MEVKNHIRLHIITYKIHDTIKSCYDIFKHENTAKNSLLKF